MERQSIYMIVNYFNKTRKIQATVVHSTENIKRVSQTSKSWAVVSTNKDKYIFVTSRGDS